MLVLDASIRATADLHNLPIVAVFICGRFAYWSSIPQANADIREECRRERRLCDQLLPDTLDIVIGNLAWRLALPKGYAVADQDCNLDFRSEVRIEAREEGTMDLGEPVYEPVLLTEEVTILFRGDDTPTLPLAVLRCEKSDPSCCVEAVIVGELMRVDWAKGEATYRCEIVE